MFDKFPKFIQNHHLYVAILAIIYVVSEISGNTDVVWQVVVIISVYIGGDSMKEFVTNVLTTLKKIDALLEGAGIEWEDIFRDTIDRIGEAKRVIRDD